MKSKKQSNWTYPLLLGSTMETQQNKLSIHSVFLLLIRCIYCLRNCDVNCPQTKLNTVSKGCNHTLVKMLSRRIRLHVILNGIVWRIRSLNQKEVKNLFEKESKSAERKKRKKKERYKYKT